MAETRNVGGVGVEVTADAAKMMAELDQAIKKMQAMNSAAATTAVATDKVSAAAERSGGRMKALGEGLGRSAGAMSALGAVAGQATGQLGAVGQAMAQLTMAAGPVGVAMAAAAAATYLMSKAMKEQEEASAAVDAAWDVNVTAANKLKVATMALGTQLQLAIEIQNARAADPGNASKIEAEIKAQREFFEAAKLVGEKEKEIQDTIQKSRDALKESIKHIDDYSGRAQVIAEIMKESKTALDEQLKPLQGALANLKQNANAAKDNITLTNTLTESTNKAAAAAAAHADALARGKAHMAAMVQQMREMAASKWVDSMLPNGGQLQSTQDYSQQQADFVPQLQQSKWLASSDDAAESADALSEGIDEAHNAFGTFVSDLEAGTNAVNAGLNGFDKDMEDFRREIADAVKAQQEANAATAGTLVSSVGEGKFFSAAGGMAGSAIGAMAPAMGIPVDPMTGSAIGGALGTMLGSLLDALDPVVTIVQILMDALGELVGMLVPVFMPLIDVVKVIASILVNGLGPTLMSLAAPIGMLIQVIANVLTIIEPFITLFLDLFTQFSLGAPFIKMLFGPLEFLANILQAVIPAVYSFYNAIVAVVNKVIDWIRTIPGFGEFGTYLTERQYTGSGTFTPEHTTIDPNADGPQEVTDEGVEKAVKDMGKELGNIPKSFKVALEEYRAQDTQSAGPAWGTGKTTIPGVGQPGGPGSMMGGVWLDGRLVGSAMSKVNDRRAVLQYGNLRPKNPRWNNPGD